jgi:hypothetical protein
MQWELPLEEDRREADQQRGGVRRRDGTQRVGADRRLPWGREVLAVQVPRVWRHQAEEAVPAEYERMEITVRRLLTRQNSQIWLAQSG